LVTLDSERQHRAIMHSQDSEQDKAHHIFHVRSTACSNAPRIKDGLSLQGLDEGSEDGFEDGCSDGIEDGSSLGVELGMDEGSKVGCRSGIEDGSPLSVKLGLDEGPEDGCERPWHWRPGP
jgi:hypothetical protein